MNCACRNSLLGVFVQSITGLRLSSDTAVTRSFQKLKLPKLYRPGPSHSPSRSFSATATLRFPRQEWTSSSDRASFGTATTPLPQASINTNSALGGRASRPPTKAAAVDISQAKRNGSILEISPESIEALAADSKQRLAKNFASSEGHHAGLAHRRKVNLRGVLPPRTFNKLRRMKILKDDKTARQKDGEEEENSPPMQKEDWQIQKNALKDKFPEGWTPRKRLSPDALEGIRALHSQFPEQYTTEVLASQFEVSPEAVRRILRSKWKPNPDEEVERQERWFKRGKQIWGHMAELGKKPPQKWRKEGVVREPHWNQRRGPRTEWPYMPQRRTDSEEQEALESVQRRLSGNLF